MRFRLLTLLAAVALLPPLAALVYFHGPLGIAFAMPHVLAFVGVAWLARKRRWRVATGFAGTYLACWGATALIGVRAVSDDVRNGIISFRSADEPPLRELDYDPMHLGKTNMPAPPWYFVGNASTPCPFLITVDYGCMKSDVLFGSKRTTYGCGGRGQFVWLFGYKRCFKDSSYWWVE